jgi:PKD repeat protein
MKAYSVLVIIMLFVSSFLVIADGVADDEEGTTIEPTDDGFNPTPHQEFQNDPMVLVFNSLRADHDYPYLDFRQVTRGPPAVASIWPGVDYSKTFRYPYMGGQKLASTYDENLVAKLDIYVNSMDVPGKTVRFKADIDRDGDGTNDTTIDFPSYTTLHNASPEHVILPGTVYFTDPDVSYDMRNAKVYLKAWRTDTINDRNNRMKIYCGFLSDTEMRLQSKLILPWVNPVPHVEISSPMDFNTTGRWYFNNENILFDGRGSRDPTGEALGYVWTFDRLEYKPVYDRDFFNLTFKQPGWYTINLNVSNSLYFTNETSVTIKVVYKNHPPSLAIKARSVATNLFEPVPDQVTTYSFVPMEWFAAINDVDEDNVTVLWDFGDGFTSTANPINHSYSKPGTYQLKCTAFDGNETSGRVTKSILVKVEPNHEPNGVIELSGAPFLRVTPPQSDPSYRGEEVRVNIGDAIRMDGSKSYDPDGLPIKSFKWDFDDVYATEENPTVAYGYLGIHRFLVEGEYNVTLTIYDGVKYGVTHLWIRTNNAPIAVPMQTQRVETEEEITFDGSRSSDPDFEDDPVYKWDFGDNTRTDWSDSPFAKHKYRITATYIVTLYVSDGLLQATATMKVIVNPKNHEPHAEISIQEDPADLWTNMTIHFSSVGSYDIDGEGRISFTYDFGDGTDPSTLANPVHRFSEPGTYTVKLTVIDAVDVTDDDDLVLTIKRNYGDSDIVIKAIEPGSDPDKPFKDEQVAVMRDGWVAYVMDIDKDHPVKVKITVTSDRPADIYLLREVHFTTYKRNPQVTFVPFEAIGYKQGLTGPFEYEFTPRESDRYYVVIDNKDWPMGTETEGPVDYSVEIKPLWERDSPSLAGPFVILALIIATIVAAAVAANRRV